MHKLSIPCQAAPVISVSLHRIEKASQIPYNRGVRRQNENVKEAKTMGREYSEWERSEIEKARKFCGEAPEKCPKCGGELSESTGYVGEAVLYYEKGCGIAWEDGAGAVARVI